MKSNQMLIKKKPQNMAKVRYKMKDPSLGKKKKPSTKVDCKGNMNKLIFKPGGP